MGKRILLLALCMAAVPLALASSASAKTVEFHSFTTAFDGADANGAAAFGAGELDKVGFDKATGTVLVAANNAIYRFNSSGVSQPFAALSPATVVTPGVNNFIGAFAVDNSGGSTQGRFYAFPEFGAMNAYEPSGSQVAGFPLAGSGDLCGVAVDAAGNIWRHAYGAGIQKYSPSGTPVGDEVQISGVTGFCSFEIDAQGNFYVPSSYAGGTVSKYAPDGSLLGLVDNSPQSFSVAVDRSTGDVYVDTSSTIVHYTASGEFVESFGSLTQSYGVAVDSTTHAVYALDNGTPTVVRKFSSTGPVTVADVTTEAATGLTRDGATVHGKLNPAGVATTDCRFEYGTVASGALSQSVACAEGNVFAGSAETAVSAAIAGAVTDTEYRYRLRIANANGVSFGTIQTFKTIGAVKGTETGEASDIDPTHATLNGFLNPDGIDTHYYFEWGLNTSYANKAPSGPPGADAGDGVGVQPVSAPLSGLTAGLTYHFRLVATNVFGTSFGADKTFVPGAAPAITGDRVTSINTDTAVLEATVNPNGKATTYHWEYGPEDCSATTCQQTAETSLGAGAIGVAVRYTLEGLTPGSTYHFRLVATNSTAPTVGADHSFLTYAPEAGGDSCPNVLVRKQTSAAATRHCRAYELVSAADTGGNDVESNLLTGLQPMPGFPDAGEKVLYTVQSGIVPGSGNPPNKGGDPYLATRGEDGWATRYVGLQADETPSAQSFASTLLEADRGLGSFAFGGPEICAPCYPDGSKNIPLRLPDGSLVKGMAGSENPAAEPAGAVAQSFSGDGNSFVFGSTSRFEPAGNDGSLTIYERNLLTRTTQVVSTNPDGSTMTGSGIAELGISDDGSRVLIGRQSGTDAAGNPEYDLYLHRGSDPHSVAISAPAADALFAGMTADGSTVYFATAASLAGDSDAGADLFRAAVGSGGASVTRVSTGSAGAGDGNACAPVPGADGNHWNEPGASSAATCGVVAIGGGGGVASASGAVYFLSPEQLDAGSAAVADQPNLYLAELGSPPQFVATLDPDNPLVSNAVAAAGQRETADFQTTADGRLAVFANGTALTDRTTDGHAEIYRSQAAGPLACVSCLPSNGAPNTDTSLTKGGLNLTEDGRVFFTTSEQLVLRDTNQLKDAYEWEEGTVAPISTGLDNSDSGILTASTDGRDVYFFTRQSLSPQDENGGATKIYDAREGGGFLFNPAPRPCVASDECHGPGTQQAAPPAINTIEGTGKPQPPIVRAKPCRKGLVKRRGKCVKAKKKNHNHHGSRRGQRRGQHHG